MRSIKLLSIAAVLMMFAVPFSAAVISSDDADAASDNYSDYFSKQLEKMPKAIYDAVVTMTPDITTKEIILDETWFKDGTPSKEVTEKQINDAIDSAMTALKNDNNLDFSSWMNFNASVNYAVSPNYISPEKLSITIEKYNFENPDTVNTAKTEITQKIAQMAIDTSADRVTKVTQIHDWVVTTMSYAIDNMNGEFVRSVWNAFCGDHSVVCEGYAKAFKAACDYYEIPCIIVSGTAQGQSGSEGHMWNYVKMDDDKWYLVDTTWDDQATINYTYLLAGSTTDGFNSKKVSESYSTAKLTELGFVVPTLSSVAYNDPSQKYHISLCYDKDGTAFYEEDVLKNSKIAVPENPHRENYVFNYWANAANDSKWDFNTPVTKDTVLYAKWTYTEKAVFDVVYDTNGADTVIQAVQVEDGGKITLPNQNLTKDGYKFIGWNTSANGEGVHFEPGSEITVSTNLTLYADWEPTEDQSPYKIDSTIESAGNFLTQETIPGVSNSILIIAAITAIVVIIAVALIARKG